MIKLKLGVSLLILSQVVYAGEKKLPNIEVSFESNLNSTSDLIPIQIIINNNQSDNAWLDINKNYRIIFDKKTHTITDLAKALGTMTPARSLRYSCNESKDELCSSYKKFDFGYDFETGKLTLYYELNDNKNEYIDSEPALSLYQTLLYSESKAGMNYRSGQWNGVISSGLSNSSTLNALVSYDFDNESSLFDKIDFTYEVSEDSELSIYHNNKNSSLLSKLYALNATGASLSFGNKDANNSVIISPILVDIKNDGILNIYDEYNNLVSTVYATHGINRIELPVNVKGNNVKLDLIVNGQVSEIFEFPVIRKGFWGTSLRIDTGITEIENEYKDRVSNSDEFYITASNDHGFIRTSFFAIPEAKRFASSLSYLGLKNTSISLDSSIVDNVTQHDVTGSYSFSFSGYDFFVNGSKNISPSPRETVSTGISRELWSATRLDFFYNQSKYSYKSFSAKSKMEKKSESYKMLSSRLTTRFSSQFGLFDFSINTGTDLKNDHKIGFSMNYRPKSSSSFIKPSVGIQFDKDNSYSYINNEFSVSDDFRLSPEIRMKNSKISQYGTAVSYSNEYINSDYSYFRTNDGFNIHVNANSYNFISRHGINTSNTDKNISFIFNNQLADNNIQNDMPFNINGYDKIINNGSVIYDNAFITDTTEIYSTSSNIILDNKYFGVKLKPGRIYHVNYKSQDSVKYISGRVLSDNTPHSNAFIKTETSVSQTDSNGYFTIPVSPDDQTILIKNGEIECFKERIDGFNLKDSSGSEIYIGRLQCAHQ